MESISYSEVDSATPTETPISSSSSPSPQRRFSPRLHPRKSPIISSPKSSIRPNSHESSKQAIGSTKRKRDTCDNSSVSRSLSPMQRRFSPRLHQPQPHLHMPNSKQHSAPQRRVSPRLHPSNDKLTPDAKPSRHDDVDDDGCETTLIPSKSKRTTRPIPAGSIPARLKKTLRIFNAYYLLFLKEEEDKRKQRYNDNSNNAEAVKSKDTNDKRISNRPDLKAISMMKANKEILYPDKRIGQIPGIEVGYQFFSRAEMVAIGFHSHWLNGIDYIGQLAPKMGDHRLYTLPIAVSIVMSGQYEDDLDNSEDIIYTGQGGHDLIGSKLQCADQVLLRGNLAMKNSMEQSVPVRVIRGHRNSGSYTGKIYTYDGLYKVVDTLADIGQRGHIIYKYHLKRIDGQPKLTTNQVQFVRGCSATTLLELSGLVCHDISNGQEAVRIPVTNLFDDAHIEEGFTYITTTEVADSVNLPPTAAGCACKGSCTNPKTCACAKLNGSDFPYVRRDGGRLAKAKDVVFECGPRCSCGPGCLNRTSQRGIKYHLEVYRTPDKGWAVRSRDFIPSGALVCEYIGLLRRSDEVDNISGNDYIFEIDCWHTMNEIEGRERRFGNVPLSATDVLPKIDDKTLDSAPEFCLDAGSRGNVARFINHSCEPNLFVQCILSTYHDLRLARVVLFAADNIHPLEELTYDYGYALDSVIGPDGKVKVLPCFCGTADCRKRLY